MPIYKPILDDPTYRYEAETLTLNLITLEAQVISVKKTNTSNITKLLQVKGKVSTADWLAVIIK